MVQVSVSASDDYREPIPFELPVSVEEIHVDDAIRAGFKMEWMSAETQYGESDMCSGAGCGSPWVTIKVATVQGAKNYRIDMRPIFQAIVERAEAE